MKKQLLFTSFTIVLSCCKIFSQATVVDPIVDTSANTANNLVYNTGEVFVNFTIQGQSIVSKIADEVALTDISIFPNPVTDVVNFIIPKDKSIHRVTLCGIDGKTILDQELTASQIDLSYLPMGVYLLKTDLSGSQTFKLIKR